MKTKTFDCVEMQHHGAEKLHEKTSGMTLDEQLAFWRERSHALRLRQKKAIEARVKDSGN
ncbi:MAG: hypothetical protein IIC84_06780 [Chloroflexi bacterium]|nr:hypothetical protein [Chloroflexota bacterium]